MAEEKDTIEIKDNNKDENLITVDIANTEGEQGKQDDKNKDTNDLIQVDENQEEASEAKNNDSPETPLAATLLKRGFLPETFDMEALDKLEPNEKWEAIEKAIGEKIGSEIIEGNDNYKSTFETPETKAFINALEKGVPLAEAKQVASFKVEYKGIDDTSFKDNEELQRKVLTAHYRGFTSFDDTKIAKLVDTAIDSGEGEEESIKNFKELSTAYANKEKADFDTAEQQRISDKKYYEDKVKNDKEFLNKAISNIDEIFKGVKVSKEEKETVNKMLTEPAEEINGKQVNAIMAKRMKDSVAFDVRLAYLINAGMFEESIDSNLISKAAKKEATSDLEKFLHTGNAIKGQAGNNQKEGEQEARDIADSIGSSLF